MSARKSSSARDILARARGTLEGRVANDTATAPEEAVTTARSEEKPRRRRTPPPNTTRYTIDLEPADRQFVRRWSLENDITIAQAFRAFIHLLEHAPEIEDRVISQVVKDREEA